MTFYMGIDIGSQNSKGVIIDEKAIVARYKCPSGINYNSTARTIREELLKIQPIADISYTMATGCGADNVFYADEKVYDIKCSARGITYFSDSVRTLIEVGARSTRVIRLSEKGKVINFSMNDRCAAGGGIFLQVIANVLRIDLEGVGRLSLQSKNPITFNTGCAVFGETEAITRVCEGFSKEDILAGAHKALAEKISAMVTKIGLEERCALAGGGGLDVGLVQSIENKIGTELIVPSQPEYISALGAAIMAKQKFMS